MLTTAHQTRTGQDWSNWADAMSARLALRAQAAEAARTLQQETVDEAATAGFFGLLAPVTAGGQGATYAEFLDVVRRLGQGCASGAWTLSFLALHAWMLAKFGAEAQAELFRDGAMPLAPAPLAPTGKAEKVEGGYRISGRWEWATGVNHADWVIVNCLEADTMIPRFCTVRLDAVQVVDVWKVAGMAATGSNVVTADNVFVPDHMTLPASQMAAGHSPGEALHPDSTLSYPLRAALALAAATPALGAAEGAVEAFTQRMKTKLAAFSGGAKQGDNPSTHLRLGEALASVRAARLVWADAIRQLEAEGPNGAQTPVETSVAIRLAGADIVRLANRAIDILAAAAGASSSFLDAPLQRHLRDVQVMRGHVMFDWDRTAVLAGRVAMGQPTTPADLL